jgi:hypothetical protein
LLEEGVDLHAGAESEEALDLGLVEAAVAVGFDGGAGGFGAVWGEVGG